MTRATSGSVSLTVTGLPTWRQGMAQWEWKEISGTSFENTPAPNPNNSNTPETSRFRIDAWGSLAVNRGNGKVYMARSGGHTDWAGNEVYMVDLGVNTPSAPTIIGTGSLANAIGFDVSYNTDGKPASAHLYYSMQIVTARNRLFTMYSGALWGSGGAHNNNVDGFNLSNNTWDAQSTWTSMPGSSINAADRACCQDPDTEDIYCGGPTGIMKWTQSTATWSSLTTSYPSGGGGDAVLASASAFDTTRDQVYFLRNAYATGTLSGFTVTSGGTTTARSLSGAAASTVYGDLGCSLEYIAPLDIYLFKSRTTGNVYQIHPTTFSATQVTTSGTAPSTVYTSGGNSNGNYNRFRYCPVLGGCVYVALGDNIQGSSNFFFLATE